MQLVGHITLGLFGTMAGRHAAAEARLAVIQASLDHRSPLMSTWPASLNDGVPHDDVTLHDILAHRLYRAAVDMGQDHHEETEARLLSTDVEFKSRSECLIAFYRVVGKPCIFCNIADRRVAVLLGLLRSEICGGASSNCSVRSNTSPRCHVQRASRRLDSDNAGPVVEAHWTNGGVTDQRGCTCTGTT